MTTEMFASMLSRILYSRRFFPFYTGCIAGGIDTKGVFLFLLSCY